jgi:hypothetical protein
MKPCGIYRLVRCPCPALQTSFISVANCSLTFPYTLQIASHFSAILSISQVLTKKILALKKLNFLPESGVRIEVGVLNNHL